VEKAGAWGNQLGVESEKNVTNGREDRGSVWFKKEYKEIPKMD